MDWLLVAAQHGPTVGRQRQSSCVIRLYVGTLTDGVGLAFNYRL